MKHLCTQYGGRSDKVGQLLAEHNGKFARVSSLMADLASSAGIFRGLIRDFKILKISKKVAARCLNDIFIYMYVCKLLFKSKKENKRR